MSLKETSDNTSWLGVLGPATRYTDQHIVDAYRVGRDIARLDRNLVTGATTGVPYAAGLHAITRYSRAFNQDISITIGHVSGRLNEKFYAVDATDPERMIVGDLGDTLSTLK